MSVLLPIRSQALVLAVLAASCFVAPPLAAQTRPCLDVDGDGRVSDADVEAGLAIAAALDAAHDPRADFDLRRGVDLVDVVSSLLVARRGRPAILGFEPLAAAPGSPVQARVQNLEPGAEVRVVVVGPSGRAAVPGQVAGDRVRFVLPAAAGPGGLAGADAAGLARALPGFDLRGVVLVSLETPGGVSNRCPFRALAPAERDSDGDGLPDGEDTCPRFPDPQNGDTDEDGLGDYCDNCPATPNPDQRDSNGDGSGDACAPPERFAVNGLDVGRRQGIDPALLEVEADRPHGVLLLTRELDMAIEAELEEIGVDILRPLARHAFIVSVRREGLDVLAERVWLQALFPLSPEMRLVGGLRGSRIDADARYELEVELHADVGLERGAALLRELGAEIIAPGVELRPPGDDNRAPRRINQWRIVVSGRGLLGLARRDEVLTIQTYHENNLGNAISRAAIRVDLVNASGLNGNAMTVGEWDGGWAVGDNAAPPPVPGGGVNAALSPRVRVRDHGGGAEGIAFPAGCAGSINCAAPFCSFGNHASHVGGTMIGDGTVGGMAGANRGMAAQAQLVSYEWSNSGAEAVCERQDAIAGFGTVSHNNSWGYCPNCNNTMGFYDARSGAYDGDIRITPAATELFCTMNDQNYRNSLFDQCTGALDPACPLPPLWSAPACAAPPAGVPVSPTPAAAPVANVANRFFTVEGPGGTAKSTVTVGNADTVNNRLANSSSMGPTLDGRLKPEVVAHGTAVVSTCVPGLTDGTGTCGANTYMTMGGCSMATPATTGAAALLYQRAAALGIALTASDVRAILAHTAADLGVHTAAGAFLTMAGGQWQAFQPVADGPDFLTGYGLVDAEAARLLLNTGNAGGSLRPSGCPTSVSYPRIPFASPVAVGGAGPVAGCPAMVWDVVWYVDVPAGTNELKVTLAWNDPAATAGANPTLVNDIDLMLGAPAGGPYHYPWWLDPGCPHRQAVRVQSAAFDNATYGDHRNTLEQVHVTGGVTAGQWRIIVRTDGLAAGPQPFSMVVTMN